MRFNVSKEDIKEIAEKAGSNEILLSVTSFGDFSKYEIDPKVGRFLRARSDKEVKLTTRQQALIFEDEVIGNDQAKRKAYEELKKVCNPYSYGAYSISFESEQKKPTKEQTDTWIGDIAFAEAQLMELLSNAELEHFSTDIFPYLLKRESEDQARFDKDSLKRWVAKKAYNYGWNSERFSHDRSQDLSYSRDRPSIERIGKKYQWMALDELLCRMADNYWMEEEYSSLLPSLYKSPLDVGFVRDIDPTILKISSNHSPVSSQKNTWAFDPVISLNKIDEVDLSPWPFNEQPLVKSKRLPVRTDSDGTKWLVIYEHQSKTEKYGDECRGEHRLRLQEFRFVSTLMVHSEDVSKIVKQLEKKESIHFNDWSPNEETDGAFLHEAPWRSTWPSEKWVNDSWFMPEDVSLSRLAINYVWESHLDASLQSGYSSRIPSPWLARELNLHADRDISGVWRNDDNEIIFQELKGEESGSICLLRIDKAELIARNEYTFLSIMIAERNSWPGGSNSNATWRRAEGACWKDGRGIITSTWFKDNKNNY